MHSFSQREGEDTVFELLVTYSVNSVNGALHGGREYAEFEEVAELGKGNFTVAIRVENSHELQETGRNVRLRRSS